MAALKLLTALRRATRFTQNFDQRRVACELDAYQRRGFSTRKTINLNDVDAETKPKQKPKTVPVPKITLLLPDNSMTVTDMEHALRMATRRKFNLVKVSDSDNKTHRATYKLMSNSIEDIEIPQNSINVQQKSKTCKLLYINANIAKHDLLTKMKNIVKLLNKGNKVKICITLNDIKEDDILGIITEEIKNIGSIQKSPSKKNTALLLITPLDKKDANNPTDNKEAASAASSSTISQNDNA
ncbi:PREDICTED: translation initiation factor IF-3 [Dinoponera quadriceps]|uniref:Translation initiation factor IF-3 n=1 Tax=Dinoponera quadriceps TaxID=609295 RepID=A0A6P3XZF0_DINQU|nr:PREDICTED: translation initiation factor IF-3 [Dinoponera quadriceps]